MQDIIPLCLYVRVLYFGYIKKDHSIISLCKKVDVNNEGSATWTHPVCRLHICACVHVQ